MEAVIIAAGRGSRLSPCYTPKPLIPILGLRLLERIILIGKHAGIRDFKIVVGFEAQQIQAVIGSGKRYGVGLSYIDNREWEKGNGVSVLKACPHVSGQFVLLMADHLLGEDLLTKLLQNDSETEYCILCVDQNLSGEHFDLDDATKTYIKDGKVRAIGKDIENYNAIDTGVFLYTRDIFNALEISVSRGDYSLSAGNQILAEEGALAYQDVTGCFWVDVDNELWARKARSLLLRRLRKPSDGLISRYVNRPISTRISAFLTRYEIGPNMLTGVSLGLAVLAAACFFTGEYGKIVLGGILTQLASILDGCDGEIARLKHKSSTFGEWFDKVSDRYADALIILGLTHALWLTNKGTWAWLLGFAAVVGTLMNSYTAPIHDKLLQQPEKHSQVRIGRDIRLFVVFLFSIFHQLFIMLITLTVMTNVETFRRLRQLHRLHHHTYS